ncbi:probable arabinosyltransferase ARAD1 [Tanacetum coccineum]
MDSRECSEALILCIGNGETAQRENNDLNVLYGSPLFDDELVDTAPECPFVVNGHTYRKDYYLADGIYPAWSTFVKSFSVARDEKSLKFKRVQEAARKDIERAFGQMWCRSVSGAVLYFADVAALFENGTRRTTPGERHHENDTRRTTPGERHHCS